MAAQKRIITTEHFVVAPGLLGLPLASPSRRAVAMLIDLLFIVLLVKTGGVFLGITAAIILFRASAPDPQSGFIKRYVRTILRVVGAIIMFVVITNVWQSLGDDDDDEERESTPAPQVAAPLTSDSGEPAQGEPDSVSVELAALQARIRDLQARNSSLRNELTTLKKRGSMRKFISSISDDLGVGFGWSAVYFTAFLALWRGQTPGKRVLGVRVLRLDGKPLGWWISFERFGGYAASFSVGLLGFVQILWDRNRQGLHDKACETVVVRAASQRTG